VTPAYIRSYFSRALTAVAALRAHWPFGIAYCGAMVLLLTVQSSRPAQYFLYLFVLAPAVLTMRREDIVLLSKSKVYVLLVVMIVYAGLTHLWGPPVEPAKHLRHVQYLAIILGYLSITAYLVANDERFLRRLFWCMGWAAFITASISLVLFLTGTVVEVGGRLKAWIWPDPNSAAAVFAVVTVGLVVQVIANLHRPWLAAGYAAPALVLTTFIGLAGARAAAAGLVAGLLIIAVAQVRRVRAALWVLLAAVVAAVGLVALATTRWSGDALLASLRDYNRLWEHYLGIALERPWFGHGILFQARYAFNDQPAALTNSHNKVIDAFVYGGGVAVLILIALVIAAGIVAWRAIRVRMALPGALLACAIIYPFGIPAIEPLFWKMEWFWIHSWLPIALIAGIELQLRQKSQKP
jgi:O-antigen ligase